MVGCLMGLVCLGIFFWYKQSNQGSNLLQSLPSAVALATVDSAAQSASYTGLVNLYDKIFMTLTISGTANLEKVRCDHVTVSGIASIRESSIKKATIFGVLNAQCTTFESIEIATIEMSLDATLCNELTMHPSVPAQQQKVILRNKSFIENITFDQPGGYVILESGSAVGKVIGGSIQQL